MHTKGEWAGQPFELADWQKNEIIRPAFGWKRRDDGLRRYRTVYVEIPKKNGKSILVAGIGLLLEFCDNEPGAEIYSLAKDRFQAAIVFNVAREMVLRSPDLLSRCEVYRRSIVYPAGNSTYQVLSADVGTKHGLNPHGILFDELHVQETGDLWDTLTTGVAARRQPMIVAITTAGIDKKTLCGEMHEKALAVIDGVARDETFLAVHYGIRDAKKEDWESPDTWRRVNPNWGISVKPSYIEGAYEKAKESPARQNSFRRLHLDEWVQQAERWIEMKKWDRCDGPVPWQAMREHVQGKTCVAALDASTVTDLTALVLVFEATIEPSDPDYLTEKQVDAGDAGSLPPGWEYGDPVPVYDVLPFFWCPEEGIVQRAKKDRQPYDVWRDEGAVIATDGDAVDHNAIRKMLQDLAGEVVIAELAVDAWNVHKLVTELEDEDGFMVVRFSQGYGAMSATSKELDTLYRRRRIRHGGHPVLAWCANNASLDKDPYDNWKPSKKKSRERIDGIVALVMALGRSLIGKGAVEDGRIEVLT